MFPLFNLNLKPTVSALVQWIRASQWALRRPIHRGLKLSSALMTSHITVTPFSYEGGSKYDTETFAPVDPPHMDTISPCDSDSLADSDSDCTLKNVESVDSPSSCCYPPLECDTSISIDSGASENPPPLVDSHVFIFRTYTRANSCTDDLDFCCAGEDRKPLRRGSLPFGGRSLRHAARTRPWSVPCSISLIHEIHPSGFGIGTPLAHTLSRPPRPPPSGITIFDERMTGGVEVPPSNKWGNNPPAGYI